MQLNIVRGSAINSCKEGIVTHRSLWCSWCSLYTPPVLSIMIHDTLAITCMLLCVRMCACDLGDLKNQLLKNYVLT